MSNSKILFFISGSVAAFKAAQVVSRLVREGAEVQCVMSQAASRFVGAATFEGLTGRPVLSDLWEHGRAMDHIHLSRWADFGVICPASANILAKMSLGLADDAVTSTLLAWPEGKPLFVFPAMNTQMLLAEATQENLRRLRQRGIVIGETGSGNLACGESGEGRLLEPDEILAVLREAKTERPTRGRVLITAGATREAIDGIRFITNHSTGRTGAELATQLERRGWNVTLLHGRGAMRADAGKVMEFFDYEDLCEKVRAELATEVYDLVIHSAAVSDYTVDEVSHSDSLGNLDPSELLKQKIPSGQSLILHLRPTAKILPRLREFSRNKKIQVVGFKLTLNASADETRQAARQIFEGDVDLVVANDWSQLQSARETGRSHLHPGFVLRKADDHERSFTTVAELAEVLVDFLQPPASNLRENEL